MNRQKRISWINYCNRERDNYGAAFRQFRSRQTSGLGSVDIPLEGLSRNATLFDIAESLVEHHFENTHAWVEEEVCCHPPDIITQQEVLEAVRKQPLNKAPGLDKIDTRVVRHLYEADPAYLRDLFNRIVHLGYFPRAWMEAAVLFFLKPKKSKSRPESYRPVSLLQNISKTLETIYTRLTYHLETTGRMHRNRFGFREGRGTELCIWELLARIDFYLGSYAYCAVVLFDFTGAFDLVNWDILVDCLSENEADPFLVDLMRSYLRNRQIVCRAGTEEVRYLISRGCPQGSCLGPVLWNIIANRILSSFDDEANATLLAYADDMALVVPAGSRRSLETEVARLADKFAGVTDTYRLKISVPKTKALVFGRDSSKRPPIFRMRGIPIRVTATAKYLGVLLDNKMSFLPHVEVF